MLVAELKFESAYHFGYWGQIQGEGHLLKLVRIVQGFQKVHFTKDTFSVKNPKKDHNS